MLKVMGIKHSALHLNEGHPAFALLERIRERLEESQLSWEDAVREVRNTSIFTTHTPVPAGHDVFTGEMMEKYFHKYYTRLGLTRESFMQLGVSPENPVMSQPSVYTGLVQFQYQTGVDCC
jgi:glycogen phosphorylase